MKIKKINRINAKFIIWVLSIILLCCQTALSQSSTDSLAFETAFRSNRFSLIDSVLDEWSIASYQSDQGIKKAGNELSRFARRVYNRFMEDFLSGILYGKEYAPLSGKYMFVQDSITYFKLNHISKQIAHYSDSLSDSSTSIKSLIQSGSFRGLEFGDFIKKKVAEIQADGQIRFLKPDLCKLSNIQDSPNLIFVRTDGQRQQTLIHFLGYLFLTPGSEGIAKDSIARRKRLLFLNKGFDLKINEAKLYFQSLYTPKVLNILLDEKGGLGVVEYAIPASGGVFMAVYSRYSLEDDKLPVNSILYAH